jgi:hypothetical protein
MDKSVKVNAHVVSMKMMPITPVQLVTTIVNVVDLHQDHVLNVGMVLTGTMKNVLQFAQKDISPIQPPILVTIVTDHARHVSVLLKIIVMNHASLEATSGTITV